MRKEITPADRRRLAEKAGINEQFLYQCLTGRRDMDPKKAPKFVQDIEGELKLWDVCTNIWHLVWPELIAAPGAPVVPCLASLSGAGTNVHVHTRGGAAASPLGVN